MRVVRRDLLRLGAAGSVLAAAPALASARGTLDAVVVDTRLPAVPAVAGVPLHRTDGDVTRLWTEWLDQAWRGPGGTIAGTTGADVLFVLETLAHDRGRRVLARADAGGGAVRWLIGARG